MEKQLNFSSLTKLNKLLLIAKKTDGKCFYCKVDTDLVVDHIVPKCLWKEWGLDEVLGRDSCNHIGNLFLACHSCNTKKGKKAIESFLGYAETEEGSNACWSLITEANLKIGVTPPDCIITEKI